MSKLLLEDICGEFIVERSKIVHESQEGGVVITKIPGRLSVCNVVNGNNRRYRRSVWEKNLDPTSALQKDIKRNGAFGLLEHPKDGHVDLLSPISHIVTRAELQENDDVVGEIAVVNTSEGRKLLALIEAGYNPLVSSRGYGSLAKGADGVDEVQEDYVCEGWDVVFKPSFVQAELIPNRGNNESKLNGSKPVLTEGNSISVPQAKVAVIRDSKVIVEGDLKPGESAAQGAERLIKEQNLEPALKTTPADKLPAQPQPLTETTMTNLKEIYARLNVLRGLDESKLETPRFFEGLAELEEMHRSASKYIAENATQSWDGQKLHNEISSLEKQWQEALNAPTKKATKLQEANTKLMLVMKTVAETANSFKTKLTEKVKLIDRTTKLMESVVTKGKAWRERAIKFESDLKLVTKRYDVATEALDIMAAQYHDDTTALSKRLLEMEFPEKVKEPEIAKMLGEAKRVRDCVTIREKIEGKVTEEAPAPAEGKPAEGKDEKPAATDPNDGKPATTSAAASAAPAPAAAAPAPAAESVSVISKPGRDPRNISESIGIAQRLAKANQPEVEAVK